MTAHKIWTPPEKPKKQPTHRYGPFEIKDEDKRELAAEALHKLWDAMGLTSGGGGIRLPGRDNHEEYYRLYRFIGESLLGKDCPEREMLT